MDLSNCKTIAFIPSTNLKASDAFYSGLLGLKQINNDEYAIEYELHQARLRVAQVKEAVRANYTIFGWEVIDIDSTVADLESKGVNFEFYEGMQQDAHGIATFSNGGKVAWFKDPDENVLSITQLKSV